MAQRYLAALASALELSAALSAPAMKLDQVLQQGKLGTSVRYDQQSLRGRVQSHRQPVADP